VKIIKPKIKIIAIIGPTSSGKSGLAIQLALWLRSKRILKQFGLKGAEIISADSRQVYKGMDIGTGKVTKKEQKIIKHHLLDVVSPKKVFTVSDFKKLSKKSINSIVEKHNLPIIAGGTGFYIDVLLERISIAEAPPNKKIRARFDKFSVEYLFKMLKKLDPQRAKTIDSKNKRRLVRALEIILTTNKPVPRLTKIKPPIHGEYDVLWIGLKPKNLEKIIKDRLDKRLNQGMIKEVKKLLNQGVNEKRLYDFGLEYRQILMYLTDKKNESKDSNNFKNSGFYQKLLREIIKYSKRQMTWFKRNKKIHWISPSTDGQKEAEKFTRNFLASRP